MSDNAAKVGPGMLVKLRSGGPVMVVACMVDQETSMNTGMAAGVHCDWLDQQGHPMHSVYQPAQLVALSNQLSVS